MAVSHYTRYVQSMVAQGGQRMADINWLFASVDSSLRVAQKRLIAGERKRALVSLQHAKNLCGFLQKSLGDLPDPRLVKHLNEFFLYVDDSIDSSLRLPLDKRPFRNAYLNQRSASRLGTSDLSHARSRCGNTAPSL